MAAAAATGNSQNSDSWATSLPSSCKDATGIKMCLGFGGGGCGTRNEANTISCSLDHHGDYKMDHVAATTTSQNCCQEWQNVVQHNHSKPGGGCNPHSPSFQ